MPISTYTGGHVLTNGYIVTTDKVCLVIDAPALIHQVIQSNKLHPTHLLLTHQHFDHTEDVEALQAMGTKIVSHSPYSESLIRQKEARENWGLPINITPFTPDIVLDGKTSVNIEGLEFTLSHIPGHSPDSITYYNKALGEHGVVFVGDTLMAGGIGRTDLPGGSLPQLTSGIQQHLYTLPEHTLVLSGHGPETTIGHEKRHNAYIPPTPDSN